MADEEDPNSIPVNHKLCGYLRTVVSVAQSMDVPAFNSPCYLVADGREVFFKTQDGVVLSIVDSNGQPLEFRESKGNCNNGGEGNVDVDEPIDFPKTPIVKGKSVTSVEGRETTSAKRKRWSSWFGMVHGSMNVVHQLHALVTNNCLRIRSRVIGAVSRECGGMRVVVLVDVYLPIALWSGWQFPKLGSTAVALFRHLSCDWEARSIMLDSYTSDHKDCSGIWDLSDCHVLGCKQHCSAPDFSRKRLFELHEIFKSLPSVTKKDEFDFSKINPADSLGTGLWVVTDDVLINILTALGPIDLLRVSVTCRHLRYLAAFIMPCMKLKLFPHQQAAVEWMLKREHHPQMLLNPLYMHFLTEDGFAFYVNTVSREIVTGTLPSIKDFRGGMFCDEPGLGKTITALSLILKTQGTLADPPDGVQVTWCTHNSDKKYGYYELSSDNVAGSRMLSSNRIVGQNARRGQLSMDEFRENFECFSSELVGFLDSAGQMGDSPSEVIKPCKCEDREQVREIQCSRTTKGEEKAPYSCNSRLGTVNYTSLKRKNYSNGRRHNLSKKRDSFTRGPSYKNKRYKMMTESDMEHNETWVQCDACHKWRKLIGGCAADASTAWFCSMNSDPLYQSCTVPEETWDYQEPVTYLPGFHTKGTSGGRAENVTFFTSVLKEHYAMINPSTRKALNWLIRLSPGKLSEMETIGLVFSVSSTSILYSSDSHDYQKIFQAFGLVKKIHKETMRWYYPRNLMNLVFDLTALKIALCKPLDSLRLYLSRATLIVVPSNLVDHWKTQIQKHVRPGQLMVYVWTDYKKPCAHTMAWDYDIVITTFNRLSSEWSPRKRSVLMQIHWLRVILDEGHTLGSSLNLSNKLQMALSLTASNRWLLTGTPTPNTPNSQLSHLQPMLRFLHEEVYGQNQKSWETGILRPFEAEMDEGRSRLLQLLSRCMISARKVDLLTIPPCVKKATFLNFAEEHAKSYNELVSTVRRNILMADWNDPSHVESLLNPKQWKFRSTTIRNVRLSCCVSGHVRVTDAGEDIQETMDILVGNGLDPTSEEYAFIKYNILHGGSCMRCNEWCRLPVITPCRHLLCIDCVALSSERCTFPGCNNLYEMQSPERLTRPENPNPKWPVPKDLIELQPSYKQDDWHPDWQSTSSSKVSYLVDRLEELQEANRSMGYLVDEVNDIQSPDNLHLAASSGCRYKSRITPPEKVIIFSQFLEHIHVIEQQLTIAGIKFVGMYSPMHSANKLKSLAMFQNEANCMALLMDGSAALGLDLSFVNHVFLMEPIWDKSMEEQVISRAHRMGATRPIHVETLAMCGTIEEQMVKFLQDAGEFRRFLKEEFQNHDHEGPRPHRTLHDFAESNYLAHLGFVQTNSKI